MNREGSSPRRPPYWLVPVFAALMLVPPIWAAVALTVAALAVSSLRWAVVARESRRAVASSLGQAVLLGSGERGEQLLLTDHQLSAHGLILGASGAGKSTTLLTILSDRIRRGLPVVAIDMKGSPSFAQELARTAADAGRPFRVWTPDGPEHWNPLEHGNATELKDKLIGAERFTEPHYQRAAERYLQTVLQVLERAHPQRPPDLEEVVAMMSPQRVPAMIRGLDRAFAQRVQDYLAGLTPDQVSAIRGFGTRLAILSESHTGSYLSPSGEQCSREPDVDVRRALSGEEVVLFSLNSSTYGKLSAQVGTLVIQDLVAAAGHRLGQQTPGGASAMVGIDEFSALDADHVVSLLARAREAGVSVILATQELADLDRAAPGLRDQVLGNTAVKIAHRQDVPASAQTIAQMAGTQRVWEHTYQTGNSLLSGFPAGRGTRRQVEQFVIHPNQIKSLRTGQVVVMTKLPAAQARTVRVSPPRREERERELG